MTYGTAESVAAFAPRFANKSGRFDNVTVPTLEQVDEWREQVSALLDTALAVNSLPTPATDATVVSMLDGFVNANVAGLVRAVNGQGRYGDRPAATTDEIMLAIGDGALVWVQTRAVGLSSMMGVIPDPDIVVAGAGSRLPIRQDEYTGYTHTVTDYTVPEYL